MPGNLSLGWGPIHHQRHHLAEFIVSNAFRGFSHLSTWVYLPGKQTKQPGSPCWADPGRDPSVVEAAGENAAASGDNAAADFLPAKPLDIGEFEAHPDFALQHRKARADRKIPPETVLYKVCNP